MSEVTKKSADVKKVIDVTELSAPEGVEILQKKTCVIIKSATRKMALKGRLLELTHPTKSLDKRVEEIDVAKIKKSHLGAMRGFLRGVEDTVDLQGVINKYFSASTKKSKGKRAKKTLVAS